jgi:mRNA interferase RelE/StbE
MTYELVFDQRALKEFKKLGATIKQQFKNKLAQVLENPHIPANKLSGMVNCYKIKLRSAGYRLVYQVQDEQVVVFVVAVGKREGNEAYGAANQRLGD